MSENLRYLIVREAQRQGVDPRLALAVATQESALNPSAVGDGGKSLGLFQLQPGAAIDAGIDPAQRQELMNNIYGGVRYLKLKLNQSGGNEDQALSRYNRGTPTYQGRGDPNYIQNVRGKMPPHGFFAKLAAAISPSSAEAAALPKAPGQTTVQTPRNVSKELLGVLDDAPAVTPTTPSLAVPPGADLSLDRAISGDPLSRTPIAVTPPQAPRNFSRELVEVLEPITAPTPTDQYNARPVVGVQRVMGQDVPIHQPATLDELKHAQQATPTATAPPPSAGLLDTAGTSGGAAIGTALGGPLGGLAGAGLGALASHGTNVALGQETIGQPGRGIPTALLETAATAVTKGAWKPVAGAVASGFGELAEQALHGEPLNLPKAGAEAGLSAVPEVLESGGRWLGRTILRNTPGGATIRFSEAATRARKMVTDTFEPETRQTVGAAFDAVRDSKVHMDTEIVEQEVKRLTRGKFAELRSEAALLDRTYKTGGRYKDLVDRLRSKTPGVRAAYDIGDLQQLSSGLRQRIDRLGTFESRTLLSDFRQAVDDSIFSGNAMGPIPAGQTPALLQQARKEWANLRAAEDMGRMVENAITSSPNLRDNAFNLRRFYDDLRRGRSEISKSVNRALDLTPGARQRFMQSLDEIVPLYDSISLPLTDVAGFRRNAIVAGIGQMLSALMLDERFRPLVFQAVTAGRGILSPNVLATLANAQRRAMIGTGEGQQTGQTPNGEEAEPPSASEIVTRQ